MNRSTGSAEEQTPPIKNYDELNVEEISSRLEGLSKEDLRLLRTYEKQRKNRRTLLDIVDSQLQGG